MPEVAQATITVTPVLKGAQEVLTNEMTQAAESAGTAAGAAGGQNIKKSLGTGMAGIGTTLTKTVTMPIIAIGAAAATSWKEVDAGLDTIITKTGASGAELDAMHGILNNITTSIPTDFMTASNAIGEVSTRFKVTGDELEDLSGQFVKFAKLNNQDVSKSVDSVSGMMAAFGMSADEAGRMLDALNTVGQQSGVDVGKLSDTLAANAVQFKQMGMSAEDAAAFLGATSLAGLDSSTAMMGMKTAMKNATEEGISLSDALAGFEGVMNSNASESDKLAAAYELFGSRAGGAIYNMVENGDISLSDFTSTLGDFEGSVDSTFEGTLDPMDQFETTLNGLKDIGYQLVEAFGPSLSNVLSELSGVVGTITDAWNGLSPEMQDTIVKGVLVAAALGPIITIGGQVAGAVTTAAGGIGGFVGKLGGLTSAASSASGPVSTAGASFGTMAGSALKLVAGAAALWLAAQAVSTLANAAIEVASAGTPAIAVLGGMALGIAGLMGVAALLGPALTAGAVGIGVFGAAMLGIGAGIDLACDGISRVMDASGRLAETISSNSDGINSVVSNLGETFGTVVESISTGISTVVESVGGAISGVLDSVSGVITSIGEAALNAGTGFDLLSSAVISLVNDTGVLDLGATLTTVASGVKNISKNATDAGDSASKVDTLTSALKNVGTAADDAKSSMSTWGSTSKSAVNSVGAAFTSMNLAGKMSSAMSGAISAASVGISTLRGMFASTHFSFQQHIAVPHFYMAGSFNAKSKSVPSVGVTWYAKAAEYGALFTEPMLIGVGDADQPELLLGEQKLKELLGSNERVVFNVTVNGADDPEMWATRLVREAKQYMRAFA